MRHTHATSGASKERARRNVGRVVLAAIVHHYNSSYPSDAASPSKPAVSTGEERSSGSEKKPVSRPSRFGKLFFGRHKKQQATSATLIDDIPTANQQFHGPPSNGTTNQQTTTHQESAKLCKKPLELGEEEDSQQQVIEFKFDLIVERKWALSEGASAEWPASAIERLQDGKLAESLNELVGSSVLESNDVCLMSVGRQGASRDVDGSHFTYVLQLAAHTLRYCFHLLEQSRLAQHRSVAPASLDHWTPFEFSVEFSASLVVLGSQSPSPTPTGNSCGLPQQLAIVDLVSSAVGASHDLKERRRRRRRRMGPETDCDESYARGAPAEHVCRDEAHSESSIDCWSCEEAMEALEKVRDALISEPTRHLLSKTDKRILLIGLKLKQRINGGLFSNRISVIDFEPKFVELHSILESAFNGQALAYLKRQQQHQQHQMVGSPLTRQSFERWRSVCNASAGAANDGKLVSNGQAQVIGEADVGKRKKELLRDVLHKEEEGEEEEEESNGANGEMLAQAEWLLYKQLSSALIRTLLVVHVHKLEQPDNKRLLARPLEEQQLEEQLMADNLLTLEFASSIQRASAMRIRRRKRHFRSHLASSNTSITSNPSHCNKRTPLASYTSRPSDTVSRHLRETRRHRKVSLMDASLHNDPPKHLSSTVHASYQSSRRSTLTGNSLGNYKWSGPDFTESSSMSTSSGGNGAIDDSLFHSAISANSRVKEWQIQQTTSPKYYTDDSDSLASAYLESRSSSTCRHHNRKNNRSPHKQAALRLAQQQQQEKEKVLLDNITPIELADFSHQQKYIPQLHRNNNNNSTSQSSKIGAIVNHSRTSSVIQIDCPSSTRAHPNVTSGLSNRLELSRPEQQVDSSCCITPDASKTPNGFDLLIPDDVSVADLCHAVAEPPKQLKLEQFLSQIGSIINSPQHHASLASQPSTVTASTAENGFDPKPETGRNSSSSNIGCTSRQVATSVGDDLTHHNSSVHRPDNLSCSGSSSISTEPPFNGNRIGLNVEEEDEDCKSHSSILDHLSTLALESMAKLNNRASNSCEDAQTSGEATSQPASGHLQRLLNSSQQQPKISVSGNVSHVALKDTSAMANHLNALSINCSSSHCHDSLNSQADENSPSPASFIHSSTSSSSDFSSTLTGFHHHDNNIRFHHNNTNMPPDYQRLAQPVEASNAKQQQQDRMYACVTKAHRNVIT